MEILFVSLGCDKNLVDSEVMLGLLNREGYTFTDDENEAEVIVVNTCSFIQDAKEESINMILEMAEYKKKANCKALIVTGCLAQRYKDEILSEIPEIDGILGTTSCDNIVSVVNDALDGKKPQSFNDISTVSKKHDGRVLTTGGWYSYLKIADGCDKHCTYCIIPKIRGSYRSVVMEELIKEAKELASKGIKELLLVAQETTLYGEDIYGEKRLPMLLRELCKVDGIEWIRILYCYPEEITDELIETIKSEPKICHYLDMPIQHADDTILKRMGRRTNKEQLENIVKKLRKEIPDIVLRTTLISGFPGEKKEHHEVLLDFVDKMEFERLGVFTYSKEEDTPAALMEEQVDDEVKNDRRDEVMELQQEIAFEYAEQMIGRVLDVLIEGKLADENAYMGRTYMDAPNVDGNVFINTDRELLSGEFVKAKITGAVEYDLIGEIENEFAK
ncbi:MAG: 30S ribosomal protein S12 methylthiotransferase RimO [Clostridiales bacterium]|nr:30S ribosomal protein S12 methylthiotransferase RimO [Clostridiales bacterium]